MGWEPVIAAGIAATSSAANAYAQGKTNLRTRQFAENMYFRQRADALSDWDKQNKYNSPEQQMQRYKDAGLNPHLIYGQGTEASPIRQSQSQSWSPKAPEFDGQSAISSYVNTKMSNAQQDLMLKQGQLLDQDIAMKAATTRGIEIDNSQKEKLNPFSLTAAEQNIKHTKQTMDIEQQRNAREALTNNATLLNAAADLTNKKIDTLLKNQEQATNRMVQQKIQAEIEVQRQILANLKSDSEVKKLDIKFKTELPPGSQPGDNFMMRKLQEIINIAKDPEKWLKDKFVPFPHK